MSISTHLEVLLDVRKRESFLFPADDRGSDAAMGSGMIRSLQITRSSRLVACLSLHFISLGM